MTEFMMLAGTPYSSAVKNSALTSFGKHDPPQPMPAFINLLPILLSSPIPYVTSSMFAPTLSQIFAISLINDIFVARKAFEEYFIISELVESVITIGTFSFFLELLLAYSKSWFIIGL
ncbi:MAG: hypothetical protein BWY60_00137 [Actinobacteria bacterium ADurb.Bin346]|nr:MAG: hypothetical protein BWY60_00137 [Actinobacteria bacterium ADurb.Bin346]